MNELDFVGIAIVGAILSLIQEQINKKYDLDSSLNRALIIGLSLVIGVVYFVLRSTTWWTTIIGVLGSASAFYALFLKKPTSAM